MNRFRNMTLILVLLLITAGALFGIRQMEYRMDNTINENKLRFTGAVSDAPPAVVFTTVALGSFRGLLADVLWLRSEMLKGKKNYFEMVQLARWITDLQPNYSAGTAYLAWNLAYNISVTSSNYEDRWYWVNEGINLIRDKAMLYNPDDPMIYRELSWIFLHKLGNLMDDANLYYKNQMAVQMTNILGSTTPNWELLAAAPANQEAFMKQFPEDSPFWEKVKKAGFRNYDELFVAFRTPVKAKLPDTLRLYLTQEEMDALDAYFRAELLRNRLKLDPRRMIEIDRRYGKMDWRVPESQAIYWATVGVEKSLEKGKKPDLNCTRIISNGLQAAFKSGRILSLDDNYGNIQVVPNLNLADSAYEAFEQAEADFSESGAGMSFYSAKINYLKDAIPLIYIYGNVSKAQEFYNRLLEIDGSTRQKGRNLDEFVMVEYAEDVRDADVKKASSVISGLIQRAFTYLIFNNREAAVSNERLARYIHRIYSEKNKDIKRNTLPPYNQMKQGILDNFRKYAPPALVTILEAEVNAEKAEEKQEQAPQEFWKQNNSSPFGTNLLKKETTM